LNTLFNYNIIIIRNEVDHPTQRQNIEQQRMAQAHARAQAQYVANPNIDQAIPLNNYVPDRPNNSKRPTEDDEDMISIKDISEPEVCSYRLNVCMQELCNASDHHAKKTKNSETANGEASSLSELMSSVTVIHI
jgi:hypothetical protein